MATKAEIQAAIQAQLTGNAGLTTHAQHEEFLHTEPDSFLEAIYPVPVNDTDASNTITTPNSSFFDYDIEITKIGRQVHIVGTVTANAGFNAGITVFSISNPEYQTAYKAFGTAITSGDVYGIQLIGNNLNLLKSVYQLEILFIDITYEVTN